MRHVLVSSIDPEWREAWRASAPADSVVLSAAGLDETVEIAGRSSRIDAVVTDDPEIAAGIRQEIPGSLPVLVTGPGCGASWPELDAVTGRKA